MESVVLSNSETHAPPPRPRQYAHSVPDTFASHRGSVVSDDDQNQGQIFDGNIFDDRQDASGLNTSLDVGLSSPNPVMVTEESASFARFIRRAVEALDLTLLTPEQTSQEPHFSFNEALTDILTGTWAKP